MPATLTPLARHAKLHQAPASPQPMPWTRTGAGLPPPEQTEKAAKHPQYAAGLQDGIDVGERSGMVQGWYWGVFCGFVGTALLALVAGFALVAWGDADTIAPAPISSKASATSAPAAPRATAPHWSAGT